MRDPPPPAADSTERHQVSTERHQVSTELLHNSKPATAGSMDSFRHRADSTAMASSRPSKPMDRRPRGLASSRVDILGILRLPAGVEDIEARNGHNEPAH
jgi:hypothetical protein